MLVMGPEKKGFDISNNTIDQIIVVQVYIL
jgi:hypothetical protein